MEDINKISDIGLKSYRGGLAKLDNLPYNKNDFISKDELKAMIGGEQEILEINTGDEYDEKSNNSDAVDENSEADDDNDGEDGDDDSIYYKMFTGGIVVEQDPEPISISSSTEQDLISGGSAVDPVSIISSDVQIPVIDTKTHLTELRQDPVIEQAVQTVYMNNSECSFETLNKDVCMDPKTINDLYQLTMKREKKSPTATTSREMINEMKTINKCETESCVVNKTFSEDSTKATEIFKTFFKPLGPSMSTQWLSNFNIDDVMDQIAKNPIIKDRCYKHIHFHMIDFANKETELANFDIIEKIKQGYKTFGCVLNTDTYSGRGQHWFALFMELNNKTLSLEYFNSSGSHMPNEVAQLFNKIQKQILLNKEKSEFINGPIVVVKSNNFKYQHDSHSCGIYSIAYIWLRLCNIPAEKFKYPAILNDSLMIHLRKHLFINEDVKN